MIDPTMEKKAASVFPTTFPGAPVIYLNTYSDEGNRCLMLRRRLAVRRSH